MTKEQQVQI